MTPTNYSRRFRRRLHIDRLEDRTMLSTMLVTTIDDSGSGSLRQAIVDVNNDTSNPAVDTIAFAIPGPGVHTIQPLSQLPDITHPVFIDGYSQPGSSPNTLAVGDNAALTIELDGSQAGGSYGLGIACSGSTIRGLVVNRFQSYGFIIGSNGSGNIIEGNLGDGPGCYGDGNLIGTNGDGVNDVAERNVIASVFLYGSSNIVAGNYIGTDATGLRASGIGSGVHVVGGHSNRIGTDGHSVDNIAERNVISGNVAAGVVIGPGDQNVVAGNYIGTDATGEHPLGNGATGVVILSNGNRIGTDGDGYGDEAERNVISDNGFVNWPTSNDADGVEVNGASNVIAGNYIGTDATGTLAMGNARDGISLAYGGPNRIGTDGNGVGDAAERNVIAANGQYGVSIQVTPGGNLIAGNFIGVDANGQPMANGASAAIQGLNSGDQVGGSPALANTILGTVYFGGDTNTGVSIRCNTICTNGLGIELALHDGENGLLPNAPGGPHTGPNNLQNYPVLATATGGLATEVTGTLNSTPNTSFILDFYANPVGGFAGYYGAAQRYLGSTTVQTDQNGNISFDAHGLKPTDLGEQITATATDPGGNTSEFTPEVQVVQAATTTTLTVSANTPLVGQQVTFTATVSAGFAGTPTGGVDFYDGTTKIGTGTLDINGVATLSTSTLTTGTHGITAVYLGDTYDLTSTSGAVTQTVIPPASLSGVVFADFNDDGQIDFGEQGIAGVAITLTGTDDLGQAVNLSQTTDADGTYVFLNLRPGTYTIAKAQQPAGYTQGINTVGTGGGAISGDQFSITLPAGLDAMNYNYGERPVATGAVHSGQTAGIGFWNNKNGQALIKALNGVGGTQLGNWLATTFSHMFGAASGSDNLAGKSNAAVAAFFQNQFVVHGEKLDAQVLATALAVYVTDGTLDSTGVGTQYGFTVGGNGVGTSTFNVGANGAAFGVANNTTMTVMDLLLAADAQAVNGVLYNGSTAKRTMANSVFSAINQAGGIG